MGSVTVEEGELRFSKALPPSDGSFDIVNDGALSVTGTLDLFGDGVLSGDGLVIGDVSNAARVEPGAGVGTLTITGDYTQTSEGTLQIKLADTAEGEFDKLDIQGAVNLAGELDLLYLEPFEPGLSDTFLIVPSAVSVAGEFDAVVAPSLGTLEPRVSSDGLSVLVSFGSNLPPVPTLDPIAVIEDSGPSPPIDLLANDVDPDGDELTLISVQSSGTLGDFLQLGGGVVQFVPALNQFGVEAYSYLVSDGKNAPVVGVIQVEVQPAPDPPVAVDDELATTVDTALEIQPADLLANDFDVDTEALEIGSFTLPAHGSLTELTGGVLRYVPNPEFVGEDSFTYTATDGVLTSEDATVRITITPNGTPTADQVRQSLNTGISEQREDLVNYGEGFNQSAGGLPMVDDQSDPLDSLFNLQNTLSQIGQDVLSTLDDAVSSFAELRSQLEASGFIIEQIATDGVQPEGDLLRVRFQPTPVDLSTSFDINDLADTPLAAIAGQASVSGTLDFDGQLLVDIGFGVDVTGAFYIAADSAVELDMGAVATASGEFQIFGLALTADMSLTPTLTLNSLDSDGDGRIKLGEVANGIAEIDLDFGRITATLQFDATLGFLDYVDVDPTRPNNPHGGDPFVVRGRTELFAEPSEYDGQTLAGLDFQWGTFETANPDIDGDEELDHTQAAFLKNVVMLGQDLLAGVGVVDYFSDVLGTDSVAPGAPKELATTAFPEGILPDELTPLADELAAISTIDDAARTLIVLEVGPPPPLTLAQLREIQKEALRDWFIADESDDVTQQGEQSVQFRLAKIAPIEGQTIIPDQLVELISPIGNDEEFQQLLTESMSDFLRWQERVAILGFEPHEIFDLPPDAEVTPLAAAERAVAEGITEAIDHAITRAESRTDASGNTDFDTLLGDATNALAWSAEAAIRGLDEEYESLSVADVLSRLPFETVVESSELAGQVDNARLEVHAGVRVKNPAGGFFPTIYDPRVRIRVDPGIDSEGGFTPEGSIRFEDTTSPEIASRTGSVDSNGRFATTVAIGPEDTEISLVVRASIGGVLLPDQVELRMAGPLSVDIQGFLPSVDSEGFSLRDGPITVPLGQPVQLSAMIHRGNGQLRNRQVQFAVIGEGSLYNSTDVTDLDAEAINYYLPPAEGVGTATVLAAFFYEGVIHQDQIDILYAPGQLIQETLSQLTPASFASLPASQNEDTFIDIVQTLLASDELEEEFTDEQRNGLVPFMQTWFEEAVLVKLTQATNDDALELAARELFGWQTNLQLLGIDPVDVIPVDNPGGTLAQADTLLVDAVRAAVARDRAMLVDEQGNLLPTATSLAPFYAALEHSADLQLLGYDVDELELGFADIRASFGIEGVITNAQLTGTAENAQLTVEVALQVNGQSPTFEVPLNVRVAPLGFSEVDLRSGVISTQGTFQTGARIGSGQSDLTLAVELELLGFTLDTTLVSIGGEVRLELYALAGDSVELKPGPVNMTTGDVAEITIDAYRGRTPLRNTEITVALEGGGSLNTNEITTDAGGSGGVTYTPPAADEDGSATIRVTYDDGVNPPVVDAIVVNYTALVVVATEDAPQESRATSRSSDGVLAAGMGAGDESSVGMLLTAAPKSQGKAALGSGPFQALNGEDVRVRVMLHQGTQPAGNEAVFLSLVGAGELSSRSLTTRPAPGEDAGTVDFIYTPPEDGIGVTRVVVTHVRGDTRVLETIDIAYSSTAVDPDVAAVFTEEELAAKVLLSSVTTQAAQAIVLAQEPPDVDAVALPALRTWYETGLHPRFDELQSSDVLLRENVRVVLAEWARWAATVSLYGLDDPPEDGEPEGNSLESEFAEATTLAESSLRAAIDSYKDRAIVIGDGDAAVQALLLAGSRILSVDDPTHSAAVIAEAMQFSIEISSASLERSVNDPRLFSLAVDTTVTLDGVRAPVSRGIPIQILPIGANTTNTVGNSTGEIVDDQFSTTAKLGLGEKSLDLQIIVGETGWAAIRQVDKSAGLALTTTASRGGDPESGSGFDVSSDPILLGEGQTTTLALQLDQGTRGLPGYTIEHQLSGGGTLTESTSSTDADGQATITFTPPEVGAGVSVLRSFYLAGDGIVTQEIMLDWDNFRAPVEDPPPTETTEAAGLFDNSVLSGLFEGFSLPGTDTSLYDALGLGGTLFGASLEDLCNIVEGDRSADAWNDPNFELIELIDFQSLVSIFSDGLPVDDTELIRIGFNLDGLSNSTPDDLFTADFSGILPEGMSAAISVDEPRMSGRIEFGIDTSSSPFYLLTQPDELSQGSTPIEFDFVVNGAMESGPPLIGTAEEPILTIASGSLQLESSVEIDLSHVAVDPAFDGKLRLDNFGELSKARIGFDQDPFDSFQAIVEAELRMPGVKESSSADPDAPDAVIPLLGSIAKAGEGEPFTFELRNGSLPQLSADALQQLRLFVPDAGDLYEPNDSASEVATQAISTPTAPTANLDVIGTETTITDLSLIDGDDWFRFVTSELGTSQDLVRVDFDSLRGDLDLVLYEQTVDGLSEVSRDVRSSLDFAQLSLMSLDAGEYFLQVTDQHGDLNPSYALTVVPPGAVRETTNLGLGQVDLQDLTFVGRLDTTGAFEVDVTGRIVSPTGSNSDGTELAAEFSAVVNNDRFIGSAVLDSAGETIVLGDDPILLELSGATLGFAIDIPFDGSPLSADLSLSSDTAVVTPHSAISATIAGDPDAVGGPIPAFQGSIDFETGAVNLAIHRFQANLGDILDIDATAPSPNDPSFQLTFTPNAAPEDTLLQFATLTASLPALDSPQGAPSATLTGFGFRHDGTPFLSGGLSLTVPEGFAKSLGLAEILPFEITTIALENPDFSDGFSAELRAVGTFQPIAVQGTDSFQPFIIVGDLPVDESGRLTTTNVVDFIEGLPANSRVQTGTPFEFEFFINEGQIVPLELPSISLGFTGLDLGLVEAAGFLGLGTYAGREAVLAGEPAFGANFAAGVAITSQVDGLDGNAAVTLTGDFLNPASPSDIDATALVQVSIQSPIPGFILDVTDARFTFDLGLSVDEQFNFTFDRLALLNASAERLEAGFGDTSDPLLLFTAEPTPEQPRAVSLDFTRSPGTHLIEFAALNASLPSAPSPIGDTVGTIRNFAIDVATIDDNGEPRKSLALVPLEGFEIDFTNLPSLADLGLPDIITVSEFGFAPGDGFLNNTDYTDFVLTVSANLELDIPNVPFSAGVENLTIDVGRLADGDLLNAFDFTAIEVAFGTSDDPIMLGPLSLFGGLLIEKFDPTPSSASDRDAVIVRFEGGAEFAGMGLEGQLLFTEYGPIAAGMSVAVGQTGLPLGPVTLFEAGALILFNEEPKPLPDNPLDLIEPGASETFSLAPLFDGESLQTLMVQNAREFIIENRQRATPIATWETPFLFAIDATLGATGVARSIFEAKVTIGANIDPAPGDPAIVLFGLGEAKLGTGLEPPKEIGTVGAVLELSDPSQPTFQFAFATPSPGSQLSEGIPASIRLGTTFSVEADHVQLDVFGEVEVLDVLQANAAGSLVLNDDGLFGGLEITVGGGQGEDSTLDLSEIGVDVQLAGQFELLFNLTGDDQSFTRDGDTYQVAADTTRILVSGVLYAGGFEIEGAFLLENDPEGLLVAASGQMTLGSFGVLEGAGALQLVREERNQSGSIIQEAGAAGTFEIRADIGIANILTLNGRAFFQFNTFDDRDFAFEIPVVAGPPLLVSVERGPYFMVEITGTNVEDPATLSLFPAAPGAARPLGIDFTGRFELLSREDELMLSFDAGVDVVVFDVVTVAANVSAELSIVEDVVFGTFNGEILFFEEPVLELHARLDRFGTLHTNVGTWPLIRDQHIFVPSQQFTEGAGPRQVRVELAEPAPADVVVRVRFVDATATLFQEYNWDFDANFTQTITIPRGSISGTAPITILDNDAIEFGTLGEPISERLLNVEIVSARFENTTDGPVTHNDIGGKLTIMEDDIPPDGPAVTVFVTPADGQISVSERFSAGKFVEIPLTAPNLQAVDQLTVQYSLVSAAPSLTTAQPNDDFVLPVSLTGTVDIRGGLPASIKIPLVDDRIAELDEEFTLSLEILVPARFAPSTSLARSEVTITIVDDDSEKPGSSLVFYSFDGSFVVPPNGDGYTFTADPSNTASHTLSDTNIIATPLSHRSGSILGGDGLPKLEPGAPADDVTPSARSTNWGSSGNGSAKLVINPGNEQTSLTEQLPGWRAVSGDWRGRAPREPAPFAGSDFFAAGQLNSLSTGGINILVQDLTLNDFSDRLDRGGETFRLASRAFSADASIAHTEVEFFSATGNSLGVFSTKSVQATRDWQTLAAQGTVPIGTRQAQLRLIAESSGTSSIVPVYFDDIAFEIFSPGYFEFGISLDDQDRVLDHPQDFENAVGVNVAGIDFWDLAAANGPTHWELRSSYDGFQSIVASGTTHTGEYGHLVEQQITGIDFGLRPLESDAPLTFRLYGIGSSGGDWQVDNLALLGQFQRLSLTPLPPVANDFVVEMRDTLSEIEIGISPERGFDPNRGPIEIADFKQPVHGSVTLVSGAFPPALKYTRTNPDFHGEEKFSYTLRDEDGAIDTGVITVRILEFPVAVDDHYAVVAGSTLPKTAEDGLLGNDTFGDFGGPGGDVVIQVFRNPSNGTVSVEPDGSFAYTPNPGVTNTLDSFDYFVIVDGQPTNAATVEIAIVDSLTRQAVADNYVLEEDASLSIAVSGGVLANDFQGVGDPLQAFLVDPPRVGNLTLKEDGSFTYQPPRNFNGDVFFTYRVGTEATDPVGTAQLQILPVNDRPLAKSQTISILSGSTSPISITLSGSDVETSASELQFQVLTLPSVGTLDLSKSTQGVLTYTPPKGGFDTKTSFQFFVRDNGDRSVINSLTSSPATIDLVPKSVTTSISLIGKSFNSYVDGGLVFLDFNGNRIVDETEIEGVVVAEPVATTLADGGFVLEVPEAADRNHNGKLDAAEGQLVLIGGEVASTGLPLSISLTAPAESSVISTFSTLQSAVLELTDLSPSEAAELMSLRLGVATLEPQQQAVVDDVLAGTPGAQVLYRSSVQLIDTVVLIAEGLASRHGLDREAVGRVTFSAIAADFVELSGSRNFASAVLLDRLVKRASVALEVSDDPLLRAALVEVMAASNLLLADIPPMAPRDFLEAIARIEKVALGQTLEEVGMSAQGEMSVEELVTANTQQALLQRIAQAEIGNVSIPRIGVRDVLVSEDDLTVPSRSVFEISLNEVSATPVSLRYATEDGSLSTANGDYASTSGMLTFAPGETLHTVPIEVNPLSLTSGGTFFLTLSDATGAVFEDSVAEATILPGGDDGDPIPAEIELLAPNAGDGNNDGVLDMQQPHVVSMPGGTPLNFITLSTDDPVDIIAASVVPTNTFSSLVPPDVTLPHGMIGFEASVPSGSLIVTIDFESGKLFNNWYQFRQVNREISEGVDFRFDGTTGAELVDANTDGLVEQVVVHLTDGGPGDFDGVTNGRVVMLAAPAVDSPWPYVAAEHVQNDLTQRSYIDHIGVVFDQVTNLGDLIADGSIATAVSLVHLGVDSDSDPETPIVLEPTQFAYDANTSTLSWSLDGFADTLGSLADGYYRFSLDASRITSLAGEPLDGNMDTVPGDNFILEFHRLTGDVDGNMVVDELDMNLVNDALGTEVGQSDWNPNTDLDRDGRITVRDRLIVFYAQGNEIVAPTVASQEIVQPILPGDFNEDGVVSLADYPVWRNHLGIAKGAIPSLGDGNGDGVVDSLDYEVWKQNFGQSILVAGSLALASSPSSELASKASAELQSSSGDGTSASLSTFFSVDVAPGAILDGAGSVEAKSNKTVTQQARDVALSWVPEARSDWNFQRDSRTEASAAPRGPHWIQPDWQTAWADFDFVRHPRSRQGNGDLGSQADALLDHRNKSRGRSSEFDEVLGDELMLEDLCELATWRRRH
ncbi:Ig-like domain-containing protein [Aeoliella sp. ICT_H6.2]|uniref:Ig-like domain-containing protein n=1 Tax=Aeoliella straminimaris TaxID=2954799 RepID=A0A9X2F5T8_9BACT|nr:Ig-like domain-containing protein [Aeoliella straminimaris]MCO6042735.1 Ig-like domain-containing protein [Aeoliella straminimaris]